MTASNRRPPTRDSRARFHIQRRGKRGVFDVFEMKNGLAISHQIFRTRADALSFIASKTGRKAHYSYEENPLSENATWAFRFW